MSLIHKTDPVLRNIKLATNDLKKAKKAYKKFNRDMYNCNDTVYLDYCFHACNNAKRYTKTAMNSINKRYFIEFGDIKEWDTRPHYTEDFRVGIKWWNG